MAAPTSKRLRKSNWTAAEVQVLLQELLMEGPNLIGANAQINTAKRKAEIWKKIAYAISALGVAERTSTEAKLKWKSLKKDVIEKDAAARRTGDGQGKERFLPFEELVRAAIIGKRSNIYRGIEVANCNSRATVPKEISALQLNELVEDCKPLPSASGSEDSLQQSRIENVEDCKPLPSSNGSEDSLQRSKIKNGSTAIHSETTGMNLHLLRRKRLAHMASMQQKDAIDEGDNEETYLFKEYLKSATEKNKLIIQKMRRDIEESEERRKREMVESKAKLTLYQNLNKKILHEMGMTKRRDNHKIQDTLDLDVSLTGLM